MKILFEREGGAYIVEQGEKFYLVNAGTGRVEVADPPDTPAMFLKWGYFDAVKEVSISIREEIYQALKRYNER